MRCPDCGTETIGSSGVCAECGGRLLATRVRPRRPWWLFAVAILGALAICCVAGGLILALLSRPSTTAITVTSPTPERTTIASATATSAPQLTPDVFWRKYDSRELGISLHYPEDWFVAEDISLRQVVFASEEENLQVSGFLRGTSLAVTISSTEDLDVRTSEEAVQRVAESVSGAYPSTQLGQAESCRIGGHDGARISFEGEFSSQGERLKGWVAAAVAYDYVYVFAVAAPVEEWMEQQAILQAMLDSVELSEPQPTLVTPSSTPIGTAVPSTPTPTPRPVADLPVPGYPIRIALRRRILASVRTKARRSCARRTRSCGRARNRRHHWAHTGRGIQTNSHHGGWFHRIGRRTGRL